MRARQAAHASDVLPPLGALPAELAALAGRRAVLVLLASRSDCPYCREVRRNYLVPLARERNARLEVREVESDTAPDTSALTRLDIRFFPTVVFLGAEGRMLAEPLVGLDRAGFYAAYLNQRLATALAAA